MRKEFMLIASVVAATFANDARINALGGSSMFDDASFIYSNPAYVTEHKIIQGNITAFNKGDGADETVGSAIGTWHMSDKLILGGYFNQGVNKVSLFDPSVLYHDDTNGDGIVDPDEFTVGFNRAASPHIIVGLNLSDEFQLGIDAGFEHHNLKAKDGDAEDKVKATVMSLDLGANMELGSVAIDASVGIAIPSAEVSNTKGSANDGDTVYTEFKGMEFDAEAYATLDVNGLDVTAGAMFNTQKIENTKAPDNTPFPKELNLGIIAGVAKEFDADFTLGLEAQANMMKSSNTENDNYTKNKELVFIAAAEKVFGQTKLFDSHSFRLAYGHNFMDTTSFEDLDPDDYEENTNGVWGSDVGLSAGFGITRGKFGLDMYVSNVDFDFNGNDAGFLQIVPVAGATMTIDFAKAGSVLRGKKADAGGEKVEW